MQNIITLTKEEKDNLAKKISALKTFNEVFPYDSDRKVNNIISKNIINTAGKSSYTAVHKNGFSYKEVFEQNFRDEFSNGLIYSIDNKCIYNIIDRNQELIVENINSLGSNSKLTHDELVEFIKEIVVLIIENIDVMKKFDPSIGYFYQGETVAEILNLLMKFSSFPDKDYDIPADELFNILSEAGLFNKLKVAYESSVLSSFIDKIISNYPIKDIERFINNIENFFQSYENFPLVILNKHLSDDDKLLVIKKTYKQKFLPKYKDFIRKNISDLSMICLFIDATIFKNNRVKEKEQNFISIIKDIFISGKNSGYYSYYSKQQVSYTNIKEFSEHYKEYFKNGNFVLKLYRETVSSMSTNTYSREKDFWKFFNILISSLTFDELIIMLKNTSSKFCQNGEVDVILSRMIAKCIIEGSPEKVDLAMNVIIDNSEGRLSALRERCNAVTNILISMTDDKKLEKAKEENKFLYNIMVHNTTNYLFETALKNYNINKFLNSVYIANTMNLNEYLKSQSRMGANFKNGRRSVLETISSEQGKEFFSNSAYQNIKNILNSETLEQIPLFRGRDEVKYFSCPFEVFSNVIAREQNVSDLSHISNWYRISIFRDSIFELLKNYNRFADFMLNYATDKIQPNDKSEEAAKFSIKIINKFYSIFEDNLDDMANNIMSICNSKLLFNTSDMTIESFISTVIHYLDTLLNGAEIFYNTAENSDYNEYTGDDLMERFETLKSNITDIKYSLEILTNL